MYNEACGDRCWSHADCGTGYICVHGTCTVACLSDTDCPSPSHICQPIDFIQEYIYLEHLRGESCDLSSAAYTCLVGRNHGAL